MIKKHTKLQIINKKIIRIQEQVISSCIKLIFKIFKRKIIEY